MQGLYPFPKSLACPFLRKHHFSTKVAVSAPRDGIRQMAILFQKNSSLRSSILEIAPSPADTRVSSLLSFPRSHGLQISISSSPMRSRHFLLKL